MSRREKIRKAIDSGNYKKLTLDLGCSGNRHEGAVGLDVRDTPDVDIVHDLEVFPYPLPNDSCTLILASHVLEHIKPWHSISLMDELWRILKPGCKLAISVPYPGTKEFWQDPTHCNGWNEITFEYFDQNKDLYRYYKPRPWHIQKCIRENGCLIVLLEKGSYV